MADTQWKTWADVPQHFKQETYNTSVPFWDNDQPGNSWGRREVPGMPEPVWNDPKSIRPALADPNMVDKDYDSAEDTTRKSSADAAWRAGDPLSYRYDAGYDDSFALQRAPDGTFYQIEVPSDKDFFEDSAKVAAVAMGGAFGGGALMGAQGLSAANAAALQAAYGPGALTAGSAVGGAGMGASATGLAGALGMEAGLGASAVNSGALNAGMNVIQGGNLESALKAGLKGAATGAIGSGVSSFMPDTGSALGNQLLTKGANAATQAALTGGDPLKALVGSSIGVAVGGVLSQIPGWDSMAPWQKQIATAAVNKVLSGKPVERTLLEQALVEGGRAATDPTGGARAPAQPTSAAPALTVSSTETDPADIYGGRDAMYDPFGTSMFQAPQPQKDALKYLRDGGLVANAAEGGSIDDILEYLRR